MATRSISRASFLLQMMVRTSSRSRKGRDEAAAGAFNAVAPWQPRLPAAASAARFRRRPPKQLLDTIVEEDSFQQGGASSSSSVPKAFRRFATPQQSR
ncbi:unnamed protein product [Urochloa humidicola]